MNTAKKASGTGKSTHSTKKSATASRGSSKRELIAPHGDKRYVRRDGQGQFAESVEVSRSLAQDVRKHAKTKAKPGQGDRGDHG